jgi:hypothetical protein
MPFILRKEGPGGRVTYLVLTPGSENRFDPNAVAYNPDRTRATRFHTWAEAVRWRTVLCRGPGTVAIEQA